MTRSFLEKVRLLGGGILASIVVISLTVDAFTPMSAASAMSAWWKSVPVLVLVLGVIYRMRLQSRVHGLLWRNAVDDNIRQRLCEISGWAKNSVTPRQSMAIFWKIIDSDATLKSKGEGVYENGAYLGVAADACVLGAIGLLGHSLVWLGEHSLGTTTWMLVFSAVTLVAIWLLTDLRARHIGLSNDQLDIIRDHHAEQARNLFTEVTGSTT